MKTLFTRGSRWQATGRIVRIPTGLIAGVTGALVLALSMNGTVAALAAKITNDSNTAGVAGVTMQEFGFTGVNVNASPTCDTANTVGTIVPVGNEVAACTLNKYGGDMSMVPGVAKITKVRIKNSSSTNASVFKATFSPCADYAQSNNSSTGTTTLCAAMKVTLKAEQRNASDALVVSEKTIFSNIAASSLSASPFALAGPLGAINLTGLPGGHYVDFTFEVTADNALLTNSNVGTYIKQAITWEFNV